MRRKRESLLSNVKFEKYVSIDPHFLITIVRVTISSKSLVHNDLSVSHTLLSGERQCLSPVLFGIFRKVSLFV